MSFKSLDEMRAKKSFQIKNLLKKADSLGLDDAINEAPCLKFCTAVEKLLHSERPSNYNPNVVTMFCQIDYKRVFKQMQKNGYISFDDGFTMCYTCDKKFVYESNPYQYKISSALSKRKIVFLFIDIMNYITSELDDGTNMYLHHSVCGVFIPTTKNQYTFTYFNSHGNNITSYTEYDYMFSRKRIKKVKLPLPMDYFIMQKFIGSLNHFMKKRKIDANVLYEPTVKFNYQHFNLQVADNYGVCFIFPFLIWYNIIYDYDVSIKLDFDHGPDSLLCTGQLNIPSAKLLLAKHKLQCFMIKILIQCDQSLVNLICENWLNRRTQINDVLETYIEEKGTRFIKKIAYSIISFLGQKKIRDMLAK